MSGSVTVVTVGEWLVITVSEGEMTVDGEVITVGLIIINDCECVATVRGSSGTSLCEGLKWNVPV